MTQNPILWTPEESRKKASAMYRFMRAQGFDNYDELYHWSIENSVIAGGCNSPLSIAAIV